MEFISKNNLSGINKLAKKKSSAKSKKRKEYHYSVKTKLKRKFKKGKNHLKKKISGFIGPKKLKVPAKKEKRNKNSSIVLKRGGYGYLDDSYFKEHIPNYPKKKIRQIPVATKDAIYGLEKGEREWGGGIDLESEGPEKDQKYPAKFIAREGSKTSSYTNKVSEILFHTHPNRKIGKLSNTATEKLVERNFEFLNEKLKSVKSRKELKKIIKGWREPFNYLPSEQDLIAANSNDRKTNIVASRKGMMLLLNPDYANELPPKKDLDYANSLISYAARKNNLSDGFSTLKEAKEKIKNYNKDVIRGAQSFFASLGFDSKFIYSKSGKVPKVSENPSALDRMWNRHGEDQYYLSADQKDIDKTNSNSKIKKKKKYRR